MVEGGREGEERREKRRESVVEGGREGEERREEKGRVG